MSADCDPSGAMTAAVAAQTGLTPEKVGRILLLLQPLFPPDRSEIGLNDAKATGTDPTTALGALHSLAQLEIESQEEELAQFIQALACGQIPEASPEVLTQFSAKIDRAATIAGEPRETIQAVVRAVLDYSNQLCEQIEHITGVIKKDCVKAITPRER